MEGMVSTDTHLMYDEQGGEGCVVILHIKRNSFAVELLKIIITREVDEYKLANIGKETYEEIVIIKSAAMIATHEQAITRFMLKSTFGLPRDPIKGLQFAPEFLVSLHYDVAMGDTALPTDDTTSPTKELVPRIYPGDAYSS